MRMNGPKPNEKYALPSPPRMRSAVIASIAGTAHTAKRFHASKTVEARGREERDGRITRAKYVAMLKNIETTEESRMRMHFSWCIRLGAPQIQKAINVTAVIRLKKKTRKATFLVTHFISLVLSVPIIVAGLRRQHYLSSPSHPSSVW